MKNSGSIFFNLLFHYLKLQLFSFAFYITHSIVVLSLDIDDMEVMPPERINLYPAGTWRNNNIIIMSKRRREVVLT